MVLGLLAHVTLSTEQNKTTKKQKQKTVINLLFNVFLECKDDIHIKEKKSIRLNGGGEKKKCNFYANF